MQTTRREFLASSLMATLATDGVFTVNFRRDVGIFIIRRSSVSPKAHGTAEIRLYAELGIKPNRCHESACRDLTSRLPIVADFYRSGIWHSGA